MRLAGNFGNLVKGAAVIGALTASLSSMAVAAPLVTLTVSPSGTTPALSNAPNFSFNGIRTSDFSSINLTSIGGGSFQFTETGFLPIASFDPLNFTPPGLNGVAGASKYGLYIAFTAQGVLNSSGTSLMGGFTNIGFTFMGDPGGNDVFSNFDAQHQVFCTGCAGDVTLASGGLLPGGTNSAIILNANTTNPLPAAFVDLLFNAANPGFFVSPSAPFSVDLSSQFSNTPQVTAQYVTNLPPGVDRVVTIGTAGGVGGSGSGQFLQIPEPASMALLGVGLLGLGLIYRRRS